jgi:NAD(P)H-hydrate epimerase
MELPALTRDQVRQVDKIAIDQFGMSGIVLMENAGRGAAEIIDRIAEPGRVAILCGSGNNAGDGYVIARHLQLAGRQVRIVSIVDLQTLQGDARTNALIADKSDIEVQCVASDAQIAESISGAMTIVDCLLGTGARGPLRGLYADAVSAANAIEALRVAIDIPTGLDCDSGEAGDPTFRADHTITFVASKTGFEKENADAYVGVVHEVGIGAPMKLLEQLRLGQS